MAGGILYLEYFYFILYLLIIAVAINAILFSQKTNIRWLQYQESLIPKLLYWSAILTLLLSIYPTIRRWCMPNAVDATINQKVGFQTFLT